MDNLHVNVPVIEQRCGRFEVLVGPERRRRWSDAEKRKIISESLAPGAVSAAVARRHGVHPNQLCDWKRELRRSTVRPVADFVPISVASGSSPEVVSGPPCAGVAPCPIEVVIGMATVRVPTLVDEPTLHRVLAILKRL